MKTKKSPKAIWWSLFAGGGMAAALALPALIIITGIIIPFGLEANEPMNFDRIHAAASHWLIKAIFFLLIALSFFHCANRFRYTLADVGLRSVGGLLSFLFYGGAIVGSVIAAVVLWGV